MTLRYLSICAAALLVATLAACNGDPPAETACTGHVAGDLVITEFMNDPDGADTGREWFELYNATSKPIDLKGFTIYLAKKDGSSPKTHIVASGTIQPKGYFVLGDAPATALPAYENYSYGDAIGGMSNSEGMIGIKCGATVVDQVTYTAVYAGSHSHQLDGAAVPDSAANDNETHWCEAAGEFMPGEFGSPGLRNPACNVPGGCFDASGNSRSARKPAAGELVITEVMPNPKLTDDTVGEWIELYATTDLDLNYLTIEVGTSKTVLSPGGECLPIAAGSYVLLAKSMDPAVNGGLPTPNALFTISLPNSSGTVQIKDGATVIDQFSYQKSFDGATVQLDSAKLDAAQNDDPANWCAGTDAYGAGDLGTPAAANQTCPVVVPAGSCIDPGTQQIRAAVAPLAGELVISEVMADPTKVSDAVGEWIELYAVADADLNGLELAVGTSKSILGGNDCVHVTQGTYAVLAHNSDSAVNGGIPSVAAIFGASLPNGGGTITLKKGIELIDQATYPTAAAGASSQLDSAKLDATANDQASAFCPTAADTYGLGDKGTPGMANAPCPVVVPAGSCIDPGTQQIRPAVAPTEGQLIITEVMADPSKVADSAGEWIELYATADVDLNGLELSGAGGKATLGGNNCVHAAAGSYLVLAHGVDSPANGGLTSVAATFAFSLPNSASTITLKNGANLIDQASYPAPSAGISAQLDSGKLTATDNDTASNFCGTVAASTYGLGDRGTPGAANAACPVVVPAGSCLDKGTSQIRTAVAPATGDLVITEIMADPAKVADSAGEWIEVLLTKDVDLNGLQLWTDAGTKTTLSGTDCLRPGLGAYVVFAKSADGTLNGGLPAVAGVFGFSLANTGAHTVSVGYAGATLDTAAYSGSTAGASWQLSSTKLDTTSNDTATNFCATLAGTSYGLGDLGSPGAANGTCP